MEDEFLQFEFITACHVLTTRLYQVLVSVLVSFRLIYRVNLAGVCCRACRVGRRLWDGDIGAIAVSWNFFYWHTTLRWAMRWVPRAFGASNLLCVGCIWM